MKDFRVLPICQGEPLRTMVISLSWMRPHCPNIHQMMSGKAPLRYVKPRKAVSASGGRQIPPTSFVLACLFVPYFMPYVILCSPRRTVWFCLFCQVEVKAFMFCCLTTKSNSPPLKKREDHQHTISILFVAEWEQLRFLVNLELWSNHKNCTALMPRQSLLGVFSILPYEWL
jgi:hypothetical protein